MAGEGGNTEANQTADAAPFLENLAPARLETAPYDLVSAILCLM